MFYEIGRIATISNILDELNRNFDYPPNDVVSNFLKYHDIDPADQGFKYGHEHIALFDEDTVIAIDISGQTRSERYMKLQTLKHRILHGLFPDNFPDFYEYGSDIASPIGAAYTIRQRIKGENLVSEEVSREADRLVFEPIKLIMEEIGCPIVLDTKSPDNIIFSNDQTKDKFRKESLYYVDVISNVLGDWDFESLRNFIISNEEGRIDLLGLVDQLEQICEVNQYVYAWE